MIFHLNPRREMTSYLLSSIEIGAERPSTGQGVDVLAISYLHFSLPGRVSPGCYIQGRGKVIPLPAVQI